MEAVWTQVKNAIKHGIPDHTFRMWLEPLQFSRAEANTIVLLSPNRFSKKRVSEYYGALLLSEFEKVLGEKCDIQIEVSQEKYSVKREPVESRQLLLPKINLGPHGGRFLRKDFTFDQFVVGGNNDFAYSAALALASRAGVQQNALFLLSNTGMGKSHLSQAVGHHILKEFPAERVYYVTAEDFTNEMIHALRHGSIDQFKQKYRNQCDVLLVEDVQFLSGKERTQQELALTIDNLFDAGKKLIFTSCHLPSDIPKLDENLRSRLSCGLISRIERPNFDTRVRILRKKSKINGYRLPDDVTGYLAGELTDNVRQLESGLIGVVAKASLLGVPIERALAESVVQNIVTRSHAITIDAIKRVVCKYYRISLNELVSRSRKQSIVRPRQIAMYLARRYTDQSLQVIGKNFNRYHATTLHAIGVVERGVRESGAMQKQVEFLCQKLEAGRF